MSLYDSLVDGRGDPSTRRVLDDWRADRGMKTTRLGVALWIADTADADAATDAAAAAAADTADADADADADAATDAAAADTADTADAADADADAAADARIRKQLHSILTGEIDMKDGLKLIQVPGRYGYSVTLAGWLRRESGDEFTLHGAVTVARTGGYRMDGLQRLATEGPKKGYDVTEPAKAVEEVHRLLIRRSLVADEKAWAKACPRPDGWLERAT